MKTKMRIKRILPVFMVTAMLVATMTERIFLALRVRILREMMLMKAYLAKTM